MKSYGLKQKLIILQLTSTFVALIFSAVLILASQYYRYREAEISNVKSIAKVLSRNLSTCLEFNDKAECGEVLNALKDHEYAVIGYLFDKDSKLVSQYGKELASIKSIDLLAGQNLSFQYTIKDNFIHSSTPVIENGITLGRVYIVFDFNLLKRFGYSLLGSMFVIILLSVFVVFFLATIFQKGITNQLRGIVDTIKEIKKNKNYSTRIPENVSTSSIQEFNSLSFLFNEMIDEVESRDNNLQQYNLNLEDIVEIKLAEITSEREKSVNSAQLASLGEMAGGIAHEINNPLSVIIGTSDILIESIKAGDASPEFILEKVLKISKMGERIQKITKGMRNVSRQSEAELKTPCTFNDILSDVFSIATEKLKLKEIELRVKSNEEELNKVISIYRIQLSQVLINLCNNAYDAITEYNYSEKWVEIDFKLEQTQIVVHFTDSGPGIPAKVREKMFNPFFTTKEIGKGTGIGLSISKSIIEKAGGHFSYNENSPNTCFIITLPL